MPIFLSKVLDTGKRITEWTQMCEDISQDNIKLLCSIQRTNINTKVTIELGGKKVTKTIAEWVWRRREYAAIDFATWSKLTDRGLRDNNLKTSTNENMEIKVIRHFDPIKRDEMLEIYRSEKSNIDAALEVVNATTDLIE